MRGTTLTFTLHADVAPEADLDVAVNVAEPGNAFINTADAGTRQVTLPAGKRTATLRVRTEGRQRGGGPRQRHRHRHRAGR